MANEWEQTSPVSEFEQTAVIDDQEAVTMASNDTPTITVIGVLGDAKLVKAEWNGTTTQLSTRIISAIEKLGIVVDDNPDKYLF